MAEREEGFTIIEVLVAAFILVLGALAVFMTFAAAIHNVQRSREQQVGVSVAQREMERVRVLPFDSVGLSSTPAFSSEKTSPYNRLQIVAGKTQFNLKRTGTPTEFRNLTTAGEVAPVTTAVKSNDGTEVTVYRFVACEEEACKSKRVVIDVLPTAKANTAKYQHSYYELQSTMVDPTP